MAVFKLTGSRVAGFNQPGNTIDIGYLPAGTYALRITDGSGALYSARVIKKYFN